MLTFFCQNKQAKQFVKNNKWGGLILRQTIGTLGVVIFCVACLGFIGNMFDIQKFYMWGKDVGMAISTSVCLILAGFSFVLIAMSERIWKR